MASIESTWDLRCNSSPRCLAVDIAPSVPAPASNNSRQIPSSANTSRGGGGSSTGGASSSTNPFDAVYDNTTKTGTIPRNNTFDDDQPTSSPSPSPSPAHMSSGYAVFIGTERGSLHYRTFPTRAAINQSRSAFASSNSSPVIQPLGLDANGNGNGNGNGKSAERVHPLHEPLDVAAEKNSPVVACIRATTIESSGANGSSGSGNGSGSGSGSGSGGINATKSTSATTNTNNANTNANSNSPPIYLILQDDKKSSSNNLKEGDTGAYSASILAIRHSTNSSSTVVQGDQLPRMSCATYHPRCGFVYAAGSSVCSLPTKAVRAVSSALHGSASANANASASASANAASVAASRPSIYYNALDILPSTVRSGMDSISCVCDGRVIVVAVGNAFYAVSGTSVPHGTWYTKEEEEQMEEAKDEDADDDDDGDVLNKGHDLEKVLKFRQSSQVHPAIVVEVPLVAGGYEGEHYANSGGIGGGGSSSMDMDEEAFTSLLFLASGRECAAVEIMYNPRLYSNSGYSRPGVSKDDFEDRALLPSPSVSCGSIVVGSPRRGIATLASPILAALGIQSTSRRTGPLMAILTSDGLVHTRSPSCIAIPLSTIEVGTRPNDYFTLRPLPNRQVVAASYGGEGRLISFREDTVQDLADRMMKLSIDAFGSNGFPRSELAEAVEAKFTATSYVGPEPTNSARTILRQYLEMVLGLDIHGDFAGGDATSWFFQDGVDNDHTDTGYKAFRQASRSPHASTFVSATAVLCLVCAQLAPANPALANRAAKSCAMKLGVVSSLVQSGINASAVQLCKKVVERLLVESESSAIETASSATPTRSRAGMQMEFVESAIWLLRSCGEHEHAIEIQQKTKANSSVRNTTSGGGHSSEASFIGTPSRRGAWSQLKYESFTATHLGELWSHGDDSCRDLVLNSPATRQLLETNPMLGLGVFTASHPNNEEQWMTMSPHDDPVLTPVFPKIVVELLKSTRPLVPHDKRERVVQIETSTFVDSKLTLPLESGRALAVTYLESLIGISTKRPPTTQSTETDQSTTDMHNELALLLLEGVLSERRDDESAVDSALGTIYRSKLRRLLGWVNAAVSPDTLMSALPTSFLRERALLLGQLGRHEDALRIFYCQLKSLDLALEYCDARFEKQQAQLAFDKKTSVSEGGTNKEMECPYLPLVTVALKTDGDSDRGISAAIRVLSLRRENIDRTAALRLLPENIPISALSQSFLVPALIDSESQARRMTVVASLLRAKYVRLKHALTETQIKSQSSLQTVPGLRSLNLGEPVYSSKAFKARPSSVTTSHFPDITIVKYFFPRYVVIQATVTNSAAALEGKTLGEVQLIVAESSDEALLPSINIAIKTLPPKITGSTWCVLAASPQRLDGSAILACELRYKILEVDSATGAPLSFSGGLLWKDQQVVC